MQLTKIVGVVVSMLIGATGLIGSMDDVKSWGKFFVFLHDYVDAPYLYFSLLLLGYVALSVTTGIAISDIKQKKSGGASGREFPARLNQWDKLQNFPIWQVAWLWNHLEPQSGETQNTPAYPTYRRLKEDLERGVIRGVQKIDGSWLNATVSRQTLIDYALIINERPEFLFKKERRFRGFKWLTSIFKKPFKGGDYQDFAELFSYVMNALAEQRKEERSKLSIDQLLEYQKNHDDYSDAIHVIRNWFESGMYEAIGRRKEEGLKYDYENIPAWKWEFAEFTSFSFIWADEEFSDLSFKKL